MRSYRQSITPAKASSLATKITEASDKIHRIRRERDECCRDLLTGVGGTEAARLTGLSRQCIYIWAGQAVDADA